MSRQIQIRRGTAAEHENFTGAPGEITMDMDAKTLRVHDGETAGGILLARADAIPTETSGGAAPLTNVQIRNALALDYANRTTVSINTSSASPTVADSDYVLAISPSSASADTGARQYTIYINGVMFIGSNWGKGGTDYNSTCIGFYPLQSGDSFYFANSPSGITAYKVPYKNG